MHHGLVDRIMIEPSYFVHFTLLNVMIFNGIIWGMTWFSQSDHAHFVGMAIAIWFTFFWNGSKNELYLFQTASLPESRRTRGTPAEPEPARPEGDPR